MLVLAGALALALHAFEWMQMRREALHARAASVSGDETLALTIADPAARTDLQNAARKARAWSISAVSHALALFEAQSMVRGYARDAGLREARVTEAENPRGEIGRNQVRVRVAADYDAARFETFLRTLADADVSFSIVEARVEEASEAASFDLVLAAHFTPPESQP
jgi:hypothetical protein